MSTHDAASGQSLTLAELARLVGGQVRGDGALRISGVGTLDDAGPGELTWAIGPHHARKLANARASAALGPSELAATTIPAILVKDVEQALATILGRFEQPAWQPAVGVHAAAVIDPSAQLAEGVAVGPYVVVGPRSTVGAGSILHAGVYVGAECRIGSACELWPHVFVGDRCEVGNRVVIWPNAVIGRDGFGFNYREGRHQRIPQIGWVVLEDDVEIGACSCVDRAKCGVTRVGAGTKIDNLVQVAHNVQIGEGCILVGQVGLAGSVRLGRGVMLGGQVGVGDGLEVGDGTMVTAKSAVFSDLPARIIGEGRPAQPRMKALREQAAVRRLPELLEKIKDLTRRVRELESAANDRKTG
jgi:UDP-3-O-[3-hydroxymyristoyl] glucosamine N-acyltransferase